MLYAHSTLGYIDFRFLSKVSLVDKLTTTLSTSINKKIILKPKKGGELKAINSIPYDVKDHVW
jgi:hypothetical protein